MDIRTELYNLKRMVLNESHISETAKEKIVSRIFKIEKSVAINYTHCCKSDIEQLVCGCGKNKPVRREPAYLHCDWCGSITEETK